MGGFFGATAVSSLVSHRSLARDIKWLDPIRKFKDMENWAMKDRVQLESGRWQQVHNCINSLFWRHVAKAHIGVTPASP